MITLDAVFGKILDKLAYVTGSQLMGIENIEEQITIVKNNYSKAFNKYERNSKNYPGDTVVNDVIKQFYTPTNSLLEKIILGNHNLYSMGEILNNQPEYARLEGFTIREHLNMSDFIYKLKEFLKLEGLNELINFQINILRVSGSIKENFDTKNSLNHLRLSNDSYVLRLFLLSKDRITVLSQSIYSDFKSKFDWDIVQRSCEFLLNTDIKRVSTKNNILLFWDNLNVAWEIYTDSFQDAIKLRKIINENR
ncbi:hypothetical protein ACE1ET_00795 [Saccharicrinis sp. FJH62]|uniref:hypothetical protein n=1 Tax=Saccharicrinis sp. FJH62 TaxID=3344657 RepID=UPI0035D46DB3